MYSLVRRRGFVYRVFGDFVSIFSNCRDNLKIFDLCNRLLRRNLPVSFCLRNAQHAGVISSKPTAHLTLLKMEETARVFRVGEGNAFVYPLVMEETLVHVIANEAQRRVAISRLARRLPVLVQTRASSLRSSQ